MYNACGSYTNPNNVVEPFMNIQLSDVQICSSTSNSCIPIDSNISICNNGQCLTLSNVISGAQGLPKSLYTNLPSIIFPLFKTTQQPDLQSEDVAETVNTVVNRPAVMPPPDMSKIELELEIAIKEILKISSRSYADLIKILDVGESLGLSSIQIKDLKIKLESNKLLTETEKLIVLQIFKKLSETTPTQQPYIQPESVAETVMPTLDKSALEILELETAIEKIRYEDFGKIINIGKKIGLTEILTNYLKDKL